MTEQTATEKSTTFAELHTSGTFVMPNFWDVGSALLLDRLGFSAMASTSAGFANAIGKRDGEVTLEEKLTHLSRTAAATSIPISADFEHGFADSPEDCAANLVRAAETGIAGASIEDWSRSELYDLNLATDRIQACAEAVAKLERPFVLTARAENLLRGVGDLDDVLARLTAYEAAGADVLYAPGLASDEQITTVMRTVNKPINVLFAFMPQKPLSEYQALGVRRISLGSALAHYYVGAMIRSAKQMLEEGEFSWVAEAASGKEINQLLK